MIYEQIPTIAASTVQSLYQGVAVTMNTELTDRLFNFFHSDTHFAGLTTLLSQISFVLCVVLALFIVFVVLQRSTLKTMQDTGTGSAAAVAVPAIPAGVLRDRWNELLSHLESTHEAQWKMAVIDADKLVDDSLAKAGYPGDTFGDRLSNIQPGALLSLDGIWWAHKIRNRLAHEVDYFLRYTEARQAVGYFEAALSELKLL